MGWESEAYLDQGAMGWESEAYLDQGAMGWGVGSPPTCPELDGSPGLPGSGG